MENLNLTCQREAFLERSCRRKESPSIWATLSDRNRRRSSPASQSLARSLSSSNKTRFDEMNTKNSLSQVEFSRSIDLRRRLELERRVGPGGILSRHGRISRFLIWSVSTEASRQRKYDSCLFFITKNWIFYLEFQPGPTGTWCFGSSLLS